MGAALPRAAPCADARRPFPSSSSVPIQRARETCKLAGLGDRAVIDPDLMEWNYGRYEGLTAAADPPIAPGWMVFRDGCPDGETPAQVGARVHRVIARARSADGDVALFAHGHVLRVLVARWIGLPPEAASISCSIPARSAFSATTATARGEVWNGPIGPKVPWRVRLHRSDAGKETIAVINLNYG